MVTVLSWIAIFLLTVSYWFQIFKIHQRKEVLDLSLSYHIFTALGFCMLTYTAYVEDSVIFMVKQIMTTIPVLVLIYQILYFGHFYEQGNEIIVDHSCSHCKTHVDINWNYCALCGVEVEASDQESPFTSGHPSSLSGRHDKTA